MDTVLDADSLRLFMGRGGRFRSYFKRPSIHLYKKCQKDVGKYETNLCNHYAFIVYASVMPIPTYAKMNSNVSARNAVLMEQQSGRVLYGKAEHEPQKLLV